MIRQAYVASAYSHPKPQGVRTNIRIALDAAAKLVEREYHVIVPHVMGTHRASWENAMDRCRDTILAMDPRRDILVLLPGWEKSEGAVAEKLLATRLGIPVMTLSEALQ